jgi:glycosyltransferase involved in cell wall biosynthesis
VTALTVSLPTYRNPQTLRRAVDSILNQTFTDLALVVVNDAGDATEAFRPLEDITDPRLVRFSLLENHGRYFADTVVAFACESEFFTTHDSDDWSELGRLEEMMHLAKNADVVPGTEIIHSRNRYRVRRPLLKLPNRPLPHMWHLSAVYRTEVFRSVIHPGFRVGYDSLMSSMLAASDLRITPAIRYKYHRVSRPDSLTRDPLTGMDSEFRRETVKELLHLWNLVPPNPTLEVLEKIVKQSVHIKDGLAVESEAERLRKVLELQ